MPSPAVGGITEGGLTAAGTNLAVTLPGSGSSTDLYVVIIAKGSVSVTINALTDWSEILDESVAAGLAVIYYTGSGVPSNPTFVQSGSSRSVWGAYRITGASKSVTPEIGATVTGGPKHVLAIAFFAAAGELADDNSLVTTFPTNYTDGQIEKTGGTTGTDLAGLLGAAARQVTSASSEDPGTFTQNASRAWRANTLVIHALPVSGVASADFGFSGSATGTTATANMLLDESGDPLLDESNDELLDETATAATGAVTASFGFTATAAGVPETFGAAVASFGFTATTAGVPRTSGVAVATFGFTATVAGVDRAVGQAVATFGFTATTSGTVRHVGQVVASFGGTFTASGSSAGTKIGQVAATFGGTFTAAGVPRTSGTATATYGGTFTAAGVDRAVGVAVASFGFTATTSGTVRHRGAGVASFGFAANVTGFAGTPPTTGVATASFGFAATAAGVDRAVGVGTASFGFTATSVGRRRRPGQATASFGFTALTTGRPRHQGAVVAAFGFAVVVQLISYQVSVVSSGGNRYSVGSSRRFTVSTGRRYSVEV